MDRHESLPRPCVGIDQAFGKWNASIDAETGAFVYVPIPEKSGTAFQPEMATDYGGAGCRGLSGLNMTRTPLSRIRVSGSEGPLPFRHLRRNSPGAVLVLGLHRDLTGVAGEREVPGAIHSNPTSPRDDRRLANDAVANGAGGHVPATRSHHRTESRLRARNRGSVDEDPNERTGVCTSGSSWPANARGTMKRRRPWVAS